MALQRLHAAWRTWLNDLQLHAQSHECKSSRPQPNRRIQLQRNSHQRKRCRARKTSGVKPDSHNQHTGNESTNLVGQEDTCSLQQKVLLTGAHIINRKKKRHEFVWALCMGPHDLQMYMGRLQTESQLHAGNNADAKGRMHATNTNPCFLTVLAVVRSRTSYSKFALTQRYGVAKVASKWHQSCPATHISPSKDRRKYYPSSALC